jgi:short-subunit dehydrogenase
VHEAGQLAPLEQQRQPLLEAPDADHPPEHLDLVASVDLCGVGAASPAAVGRTAASVMASVEPAVALSVPVASTPEASVTVMSVTVVPSAARHVGLTAGQILYIQRAAGKPTPPAPLREDCSMSSRLLSDRTVVVTGGASGIGLVVARRCAVEAARVALLDVAGDPEAVARSLAEETGADAVGVRTDVTDPASLEASADAVTAAFGSVDVVVVNAGILHLAPVLDLDPAKWRRVLEVNLTGAFLTCQVYGRRLVEQGRGGRIVLSSSLFGLRGGPENGAYSASKFGMIGLMQCLAAELAPHGITVNAVCPGR